MIDGQVRPLDEFRIDQPVVPTHLGKIGGVFDPATRLSVFLGVPYAAPPIGLLRFRPAMPHPGWTGVHLATAFGSASAQLIDPAETIVAELADHPPSADAGWVGSEDSLTLNIWTPGLDAGGRPVLIYVHGGANWLESSRGRIYHGDHLAAAGDVVVVTFNYRLGPFGFLDLSVLGSDAPTGASGHGLTDQLAAIDWVRADIAAFGGDPDNITLIGESAGSMNISWHLAAGHLSDRVRRVVMMSGVASVSGFGRGEGTNLHSLAEGRRRAKAFWGALGITCFADLQALSTEALMARYSEYFRSSDILFDLDTLFYPRIDGAREVDPFTAAAEGRTATDVMIGFTSYEMGLWLQWDDMLDQRDTSWAAARVAGLAPHLQVGLAAHYDQVFAHEPPGVRGMYLLGDAMFVMPSIIFTEAHARAGGRAWLYQYDQPATDDPRKRALHAADIACLFGTFSTPAGFALVGPATSAEEQSSRARLTDEMQNHLFAFAHGGMPDDQHWPQYRADAPEVMNFGTPTALLKDPFEQRWSWWRDNLAAPELGWSRP